MPFSGLLSCNNLNPDDTSVYHIFERLNTGGTLLSNQEIRNCVHSGRFVEYMAKLNVDVEWRDPWEASPGKSEERH